MAAQYIESPHLSNACKDTKIKHGFFTRKGGVSHGIYNELNCGAGSDDKPEDVQENRQRICKALDVAPSNLVTVHQHHSSDIFIATHSNKGERPKADGIVSNAPGLAIGILTADCGPVLFADPANGVIGAAHAGWRGAVNGVLENTITKMEEIGAKRENISASLGPCISQKNYEVGPEFFATFTDKDPNSEQFFQASEKADHYQFDLHMFIAEKLQKSGIHSQILGICTYEQEGSYFSYRRTTHRNEPDYGRQLSVIAL